MDPTTSKITIEAPRERVFEVVSDLAMRPLFCDHFMEEFRLQRIESTGTGAAARFRTTAPMFAIWMETVIVELEAPHVVLERGRGARLDRMPTGTAWELVTSDTAMTDVSVTFWTEPSHRLDKLKELFFAAGWYERQWNHALRRLRDLVEEGAHIEGLRIGGASRP